MGCLASKHEPVEELKQSSTEPLPFLRHSATTVEEIKITPGQFIRVNTGSYKKDYKFIKELGKGGFGIVCMAEHKVSHLQRAIKEIMKPQAEDLEKVRENFIMEVSILARLDHPNIMKIYEMYEDSKSFYVVSELISGGELFDYIIEKGSLSESLAATIMKQVLSAVNYLHKHNIVHRDLKPENLMLEKKTDSVTEMNLKLIDFGTSMVVPDSGRLKETIGTMYYMAPEVLDRRYDAKCDIWSLGVILYMLITGSPPFPGDTEEEIINNIYANRPDFERQEWWSVSPEARAFAKRLLTADPRQRPTAHQCLQDPWILSSNQARIGAEETAIAVSSLKHFRGDIKLKQAVSTFITTQLLSKEELEKYRNMFQSIDVNGDGVLSKEEMIAGLAKAMPMDQAVVEVERIMEQVDTDKSGLIDYTEFLSASAAQGKNMSRDVMQRAFRMIDEDGSGKIGLNELKNLLGKGVVADETVWTELLKQADKDGDGEIDIDEFTELMLKTYS